MSSRTSQASSSENTLTPSAAASAPASAPAYMTSSPSMPRPIQAPTLLPSSIASSFERLLRCTTSISPSVLVHGERVDDAHHVALLQTLQLGDNLAAKLRARTRAPAAEPARWAWLLLWLIA